VLLITSLLVSLCSVAVFVRANTSEDVTMATWGGSTAGNLESIDEDDDAEDEDEDEDDENSEGAAGGRNGE